MSDDVKQAALEEAQRTYKGFINFIKWISAVAILLILVMGFMVGILINFIYLTIVVTLRKLK